MLTGLAHDGSCLSLNTSSQHRNNSINTFPSTEDPILGSGQGGWGPAPHNSRSELIPRCRHECLPEQCSELPQRRLPTDVSADDLECWWFEIKLYARSVLHERSRRGKDFKSGAVREGFITPCTGQTECVQRHSMALRSKIPLKLGEISWKQNTIVLYLLRMGQNQWLWGTPAELSLGRVVGAQVSGLLHVHHTQT